MITLLAALIVLLSIGITVIIPLKDEDYWKEKL
jgi:hypothetical protein